VLQYLGVWQSEDRSRWRRIDDLVFKVALVKDVPLSILYQKDDTLLVSKFRFRIDVVSGFNTCS
jgi:hypothetical protein